MAQRQPEQAYLTAKKLKSGPYHAQGPACADFCDASSLLLPPHSPRNRAKMREILSEAGPRRKRLHEIRQARGGTSSSSSSSSPYASKPL
jgi:hypothetical protein